jgi:nitrate reductase delta subunit
MAVLGSARKAAGQLQAIDQVAEAVRRRYALPEESVVSVSELACGLPGCPPLETVVLFWPPDGVRHRIKIFKPAHEVSPDDMPAPWLRRALVSPEGEENDCC